MTSQVSGSGRIQTSGNLSKPPRSGRRHSIQVSNLGKDMEKLKLSGRKEEDIKEGVKSLNPNTGISEDRKKELRKMSTKRRPSRQGVFRV